MVGIYADFSSYFADMTTQLGWCFALLVWRSGEFCAQADQAMIDLTSLVVIESGVHTDMLIGGSCYD